MCIYIYVTMYVCKSKYILLCIYIYIYVFLCRLLTPAVTSLSFDSHRLPFVDQPNQLQGMTWHLSNTYRVVGQCSDIQGVCLPQVFVKLCRCDQRRQTQAMGGRWNPVRSLQQLAQLATGGLDGSCRHRLTREDLAL